MDCFVKRFQPERFSWLNVFYNIFIKLLLRYDNWLAGKDLGHHPCDDPNMTMSIAPPPSAEEFLVNKTNNESEVILSLVITDSFISFHSMFLTFLFPSFTFPDLAKSVREFLWV